MALSNDRLLEGLYGLGVDINTLRSVDKNLPPDTFRQLLENAGIKPVDFQRAEAVVSLRTSGGGTLTEKVRQVLVAMGATSEGISRAEKEIGGNSDPKAVLGVLTNIFGEQRAGNIMIKVTGVKPPAGTIWNPFRGDTPPPNTDTRYGSMGTTTAPGPGRAPEGALNYNLQRGGERGDVAGQPPQPAPQQIPAKAPGGPGGGGGGGGGGHTPGLTPKQIPRSPQEIDAWIKKHFGADAWFMDIPEVHKILTDLAATGSTDGEEATRQVTATNWYKNTSASSRSWTARQKSDPGSIQSDVAEQVAFLSAQAKEMGIEIEGPRLDAIARSSLRYGWSPVQIKAALGAEFEYDPANKNQSAQIGEMKALAAQYLVPLSDEAIKGWGKGMATGEYTVDQFKEYLKGNAKSLFPQMAAHIDAGHTVEDFVNPYKQIAAQTLEIPASQINFMDPQWRKPLDQIDPKTGQRSVMTLSDWTSLIKTDKTYGYDKTSTGIGEAASLATQIMKKFGATA